MELTEKQLEIVSKLDKGKVITHGGKFHADDVFSTALLKLFYIKVKKSSNKLKVERVLDVTEEDKKNYVVYDIGAGEYDHHQEDSPIRENDVPYAAFGLL